MKYENDPDISSISIQPDYIVKHNWKKLSQMWKGINSYYRLSLTNFTTYGTHEPHFIFCNLNHSVYYLCLNLLDKPHLNVYVESYFPDVVVLDYMSPNDVGNKTPVTPKRNTPDSEVSSSII